MKSSDFNGKINEAFPGLHYWIGDIGAAGLGAIKDRFTNKGLGDMPVLDRATMNAFIRDFVGRASTAIDRGIASGLIVPKAGAAPGAGPTQKLEPQQDNTPPASAQKPNFAQGGYGNVNINAPTGITPKQGVSPTPPTVSPTVPPVSPTVPKQPEPKPGSPEYFAAKRAAAAQAAQASMVPFSKLPADQYAKTAANIRQQKQATAAQAAQASMTPVTSQANATKMNPKAAAALKGRLQAGQGIGQKTGTGFSNYVKGSGERLQGADASGAPVFKKIQRENKFQLLNNLFESILNFNEETPDAPVAQGRSIEEFLKKWFTQYTKLYQLPSVEMGQVDKVISDVANSYSKDKGYKALQQLGNLAYVLMQTYTADQGVTSVSKPTVTKDVDADLSLDNSQKIQKAIQKMAPPDLKDLYKELTMREYTPSVTKPVTPSDKEPATTSVSEPVEPAKTATTIKGRGGRAKGAEPSQTKNAIRKREARAKAAAARTQSSVTEPTKQTKTTSGGPTPDEIKNFQNKVQAAIAQQGTQPNLSGQPGQGIQNIAKTAKKKPKSKPAAYK